MVRVDCHVVSAVKACVVEVVCALGSMVSIEVAVCHVPKSTVHKDEHEAVWSHL